MHKNTLKTVQKFFDVDSDAIERAWNNPAYGLPQFLMNSGGVLSGSVVDGNKRIYYYLIDNNSTTPINPKEKIIEEIFVPELNGKLIKTVDKSIDDQEKPKPAYMQESSGFKWLEEANLNTLTDNDKTDVGEDLQRSKYMEVNKKDYPVLDKILKSFGKWYPKYLGGGRDGHVWSIAPSMVLKIFSGQDPYLNYKSIADQLWSGEATKHEIMVYDTGELPNSNLYWVVMEKVMTSAPKELPGDWEWVNMMMMSVLKTLATDKEFNALRDEFKQSFTKEDFVAGGDVFKRVKEFDLKNKVHDFANKFTYKFASNSPALINKLDRWLKENKIQKNIEVFFSELVFSICWNIMFGRGDLHLGNLGWRPGEETPTFFDPTYGWHPTIELDKMFKKTIK